MPGEARVDYLYMPTYIATGILMNCRLNYPAIAQEMPGFTTALKKGLLASTGRNFAGHGLDSQAGLIRALNVLLTAKAHIFVELFPDYCQEFTRLFTNTIHHLHIKCIT